MRVSRRARRLLLPGVSVFLDVDNLDSTDELERHIEQSQAVLVFLSKGYFFSENCLRELDHAIALEKPLILVHEADLSRGGALLESIRSECASKRRMQVFEGGGDEERPVITWQRAREFQIVAMREICAALLHAAPEYSGAEDPPDLYVPGEVSFQLFAFERPVKLWVSPHNPGARRMAEELVEHVEKWRAEMAKQRGSQSPTLVLIEGGQSQSTSASSSSSSSSSPPPSPPEVPPADVPPPRPTLRRSASLLSGQHLHGSTRLIQLSEILTGPRAGRSADPNAALLYLNRQSFVGLPGQRLAEEIRLALRVSRSSLVLAHELDPERGGCSFDALLHNTPEDLISLGLYKKLAVACHPEPLRSVSLTLVAKALGAVPVQPWLQHMATSSGKIVDQAVRRATVSIAQGMRLGSMSSPAKPSARKAGKSKYTSSSVSSNFLDLQSASQEPTHEIEASNKASAGGASMAEVDEDAKRLAEVEEELAGLRDRRLGSEKKKVFSVGQR